MSEIVDAAVKALNARLDGEGIDGSVKFVIEDEGAVRIDAGGAVAAGDGDADCTLTASADTFREPPRRRPRPDRRLHERPADRRRRHGPRHEARQPAGMTARRAVLSPRSPTRPAGARGALADHLRRRPPARGGLGGRQRAAPRWSSPAAPSSPRSTAASPASSSARGLSVAVIDWRGQGLVGPATRRTPMLGHVEDFRDYQRDVAALHRPRRPRSTSRRRAIWSRIRWAAASACAPCSSGRTSAARSSPRRCGTCRCARRRASSPRR